MSVDNSGNFFGLVNGTLDVSKNNPIQNNENTSNQKFSFNSFTKPEIKYGSLERASLYNPIYQSQYKPRYEAANAYDQLGFDPRRDNEKLYNEKMSGWDKFQRAGVQTVRLALAAGLDSLTFGATSKNTMKVFSEANAIGGSTEGGIGGMALNQMINAGFCLGIAGEVIAENAVLAALTGGVGNLAAAAKTGKDLMTIRRGIQIAEAARKQAEMARGIENMAKASKLSEFAKRAIDFINPIENTTNFIGDIGKAERVGKEMNSVEKISKGTTALWNDVQSIRGVYTESILEGNFAEKDMEDEWLADFQSSHGRGPTESEYNKFKENALAANYATSMINMPMIFLTNKMTLGPLFRPLEKMGSGSVLSIGSRKAFLDVSKTGLRTVKKLPSKITERLKLYASHPMQGVKAIGRYGSENFFEGFQEIAQDITSGSVKDYYFDNYDDNLRGSWYNYMLSNSAKQISMQGLETFASGAMMQMFISPVTHTLGAFSRGFKGDKDTLYGRAVDKLDNLVHSGDKEYLDNKKKLRDQEEKQFDKDLEELNFFFNNAANYFNGNFTEMAKSKKFQDEYYKGKEWSDLTDDEKKGVKDNIHTRMNDYVINAIQRGYYDSVIDQIKDMSRFSKSSKDELVSDIGQEQADAIENNADAFLKQAEQIKKDYDEITDRFPEPFSKEDLQSAWNSTDPMTSYNSMIYANYAHKCAVRDYIFCKDQLRNGIQNQVIIDQEAQNIFKDAHSNMTFDEISSLYDIDSANNKLNEIKGILNGTMGGAGLLSIPESDRTPEMKKRISDLKTQQALLEDVVSAIDSFYNSKKTKGKDAEGKDILVDKTESDKKKDVVKLKKAIQWYLKHVDNVYNDAGVLKLGTFDALSNLIFDYIQNTNDIREVNQSIQFLTDPTIWRRHMESIAKAAKDVHENRKESIKKAVDEAKSKIDDDELSKELLNIGVVCENLDDVRKNKKMPSILIDSESKTDINYLSPKYQKAMEIMKKYIPDLVDIPIPERKENGSTGLLFDDNHTIEEFKSKGLIPGKSYTAKDVLQIFLNEPVLRGETGRYTSRRSLANAFLGISKAANLKVNIVTNASYPVTFTKDAITLDLRYFSTEYKTPKMDYSFALMKGIVGALTMEELLNKESTFTKDITVLYEKAKTYFESNKDSVLEDLKKDKEKKGVSAQLKGLESLQDFVIEALTNERFQMYLSKIKHDGARDSFKRNAFAEFVDKIKSFFDSLFGRTTENTLLDESLSVITDYISDKNTPTQVEDSGNNPQGPSGDSNIETKKKKKRLSYDATVEDLLELSDEDKEKLVNTAGSLESGESYDDAIQDKEFIDWFHSSFAARIFVNQYNSNLDYENENEDDNVASRNIDINLLPMSKKEKDKWNQEGKVSQGRIVLIALKLLRNDKAVDEAKDLDSILSKEEIDICELERTADLIASTMNNIEDANELDVTDITLLNSKIDQLKSLGYNGGELYKLKNTNPRAIFRLAAENIPFNERKKMVSAKESYIKIEKDVKDIEQRFEAVSSPEELIQLKNNAKEYLSFVPEDRQTFTQDEIIVLFNKVAKEKNFDISDDDDYDKSGEKPTDDGSPTDDDHKDGDSRTDRSVDEEKPKKTIRKGDFLAEEDRFFSLVISINTTNNTVRCLQYDDKTGEIKITNRDINDYLRKCLVDKENKNSVKNILTENLNLHKDTLSSCILSSENKKDIVSGIKKLGINLEKKKEEKAPKETPPTEGTDSTDTNDNDIDNDFDKFTLSLIDEIKENFKDCTIN